MGRETGDETLVDLAIGGDKSAANELFTRYYDKALTTALTYCDNLMDRQDLVQETFLKAWQQLSSLQSSASFWSWLRNIMHNHWVNQNKGSESGPWLRRYYEPEINTESTPVILSLDALIDAGWDIADPDSDPAQRYVDYERDEVLRGMVSELPPQQARCLKLAIDGYHHQEIAEKLGLSCGAVRNNIYWARQKMKQKMATALP